jgi:hypothetical protein
MSGSGTAGGYALEGHTPLADDPDWSIVTFKDPAEADIGGLTITVSEATLQRLQSGDLKRPLSSGEVMQLDGT